MRSLIGAIAIRTSLPALAAAALLGFAGAAHATRCADPSPPFRIAQQQTVDSVQLRALEAPGTVKLPRLVFLDGSCHPLFSTVFGRRDPEARGSVPPPRLLRFRALTVPGMPDPVLLATMASPGGDDTEFETQLFAEQDGGFHPLLSRAAISVLEGGVFLGDLGQGIGPGLAVWNMVPWPGEVHAGPHRYMLQRWRWTGQDLAPLPALTTQSRYGDPAAALRELGLGYRDMTRDFADFPR